MSAPIDEMHAVCNGRFGRRLLDPVVARSLQLNELNGNETNRCWRGVFGGIAKGIRRAWPMDARLANPAWLSRANKEADTASMPAGRHYGQ